MGYLDMQVSIHLSMYLPQGDLPKWSLQTVKLYS